MSRATEGFSATTATLVCIAIRISYPEYQGDRRYHASADVVTGVCSDVL